MKILHDIASRFELYVIGPIWGYLHKYYLSGLFWASPYVWISLFWAANWIIGTILALLSPPPLPGQVDERWRPRKSLQSVVKLLIWLCAFMVATGLQRSGIPGGWLPAGIITAAGVLTEGAYLLRNLGRIAKKFGNARQGEILGYVADTTEEFMDSRIHKKTTITLTETTVIEPSPEPKREIEVEVEKAEKANNKEANPNAQ